MLVNKILKPLKTAVLFSLLMFLLCGLAYPLLLTGLAQVFFPAQANGSLVYVDGKAVGSKLIGQDFSDKRFMKCRPSAVHYNVYTKEAAENGDYSGIATGSKNHAPSNPDLAARVEKDVLLFLEKNPTVKRGDIPADLLTASGSGLDPHISPKSAALQIEALSKNTGLSVAALEALVKTHTTEKLLGVFGEQTVNVLMVNLDIAKALGQIDK